MQGEAIKLLILALLPACSTCWSNFKACRGTLCREHSHPLLLPLLLPHATHAERTCCSSPGTHWEKGAYTGGARSSTSTAIRAGANGGQKRQQQRC